MRRFLVLPCLLSLALSGAAVAAESLEVDGVNLQYEITGSGDPLFLIHGWAVNRGFWDGVAERLAPHFKVVRYDRRGFGESGGRIDPTVDPADLAALMRATGHRRALVMGHSAGATVALTFAVRYPEMVDALILYGPPPPQGLGLPWDGKERAPLEKWAEIGSKEGVQALRDSILGWAEDSFGDAGTGFSDRARRLLGSYSGLDLLDPEPPSNRVPPARMDELGSVQAPTLVVIGQDEMAYIRIAAEAIAYGIPGASKRVVAGGGHCVSWTEPERFVAEILRFLRSAGAAPAPE